jgi:hypothetical protein
MPRTPNEPTRERPPQIRARTSIDRFKAAQLVANILAPFPPTVRTAILAMALAGDVDRQPELPLGNA